MQALTRQIALVQRDAQTLAELVARAPGPSAASGVQDGEVMDAQPIDARNGSAVNTRWTGVECLMLVAQLSPVRP
jgi:hypothetical protein